MASSCEEQLLCPICLQTHTVPVTTPCGHNYCKTCITEYLSHTDEPHCPMCREALQKQLELKVNTALQHLVEHFSNVTVRSDGETPAQAWEVTCDMCCEPKLKAQRSCLKCLASYCQPHLEQHQRVSTFKRHQLVDPVSNLEAHICRDHDELLTSFCKKDQMCVCATCLKRNHAGHNAVPLELAFKEKKDLLVPVVSEIEAMEASQRKTMENLKCLAEHNRKKWKKEEEEIEQLWTSLAVCLQKGRSELAKLRQERQKAAQVMSDCLVARLEQDIADMQRRRGELERVLERGDQVHLLQNFASLSSVPRPKLVQSYPRFNSDVDWVKKSIEDMKIVLNKEMRMLNDLVRSLPSPDREKVSEQENIVVMFRKAILGNYSPLVPPRVGKP